MRLIDADLLKVNCKCTGEFAKVIDAQPTAYDIDKVVEELEKMEEKALRVQNYDVSFYATGQMHKAIEIVKQGHESDDVCEWKRVDEIGYQNCEYDYDEMPDFFKFCPYCGKKIKVVE